MTAAVRTQEIEMGYPHQPDDPMPDTAENMMASKDAISTTAEEWNATHKVGIGVLVKLDTGKLWHTKTRSEAWELGGHTPVVMLEGRSGGYLLSRVTPMERQETILA